MTHSKSNAQGEAVRCGISSSAANLEIHGVLDAKDLPISFGESASAYIIKRSSDPRKPVSRSFQSWALNQISWPIIGEAIRGIDSLASILPSTKSLIMPDSFRPKVMAILRGPLLGGANLFKNVSPYTGVLEVEMQR